MKQLLIIMVIIFSVLYSCSTQSLTGSTDTGNVRVSAVIYKRGGGFATDATVRLRQADFLADNETESSGVRREVLTDNRGYFYFDSLKAGRYCIEVNDRSSSALLFTITVDSLKGLTTDSIIDTLKPYAKVSGTISKSATTKPHYCLIYGLQRKISIDSSGNFSINDLPEGTYTLRIIAQDTTVKSLLLNNIAAHSGNTVFITNVDWNYSRKLFLNTTSNGANIAGVVHNFPVLIRLTSSNFNFDSAAVDGSDLRFTDSENRPLDYEIEHWDNNTKAAELWVKVDSIRGNDSTQYIKMYWGKTGAVNVSKSSNVFDTADGFQGVWHFSNIYDTMSDATSNHFKGSSKNIYSVQGLIGESGEFDGFSSYMFVPGSSDSKLNFSPNDNYSLSLWVFCYDSVYSRILTGKGDYQYAMKIKNQEWAFSQCNGNTPAQWESTSSHLKIFQWHHLTAVRKGNLQYLYVDGVCTDTTIENSISDSTRNTSGDFHVGTKSDTLTSQYRTHHGKMEELRIANRAYNPDWIKLSYMNQQEKDKLVIFK